MTFTISKTKLAIGIVAVAMLIPTSAMAFHVFDDVPDDKFYAGPVEWAFDNGITTGKTVDLFAPDDAVTRGESVTFLKRFNDNVVEPADEALQDAIDALEAALATHEANTLSATIDGSGNLVFGSGVESVSVLGTSFTLVKFTRDINECVSVAQVGTTSGTETTTGHIDISYEASDTIGMDIENNSGTNTQLPVHLVVHC